MDATTVAVDVAKTVFEVAIANRQGHIVARHRFNRRQFTQFLATTSPTHVVMEACGTAHYWGRCAQRHGHTVTLLPPAYVRPYVRRNKTDRTDAEALLEATRSGQIPTVPVKSVAQQTLVALHRIRAQWMATRTARINALRGILREQGVLLPAGAGPALRAIPALLEEAETTLANPLCRMVSLISEEVRKLDACIGALERELRAMADADPVATRLREIPGIGLLTATALVGTVGHMHAFRRARQFSSWLGLTPREYSSVGRSRRQRKVREYRYTTSIIEPWRRKFQTPMRPGAQPIRTGECEVYLTPRLARSAAACARTLALRVCAHVVRKRIDSSKSAFVYTSRFGSA